jgi:hypothetical protein
MGNVHRLSDPAWIGAVGLSVGTSQVQPNGHTYDFINRNDGGDTGTGAANAYGKASGGPNQHSYYVTLGEDAISFAVNRGMKALSENSDVFDDLLNADKIRPAKHNFSLGAPGSTITLPADAYLGPPTTVLTADVLQQLFRVCDFSGEEMVDLTSNTAVVVQSSSVAASPTPPYTAGGETLTTNIAMVIGSYTLVYYARTSYALSNRELLRLPYLQTAVGVPGGLQVLLQTIRGDGLLWNATVEVSLRTLAVRGLDGLYRSSTTVPTPDSEIATYFQDTGQKDTAGSGAYFKRDAQALTGLSRTDLQTDTPLLDLFGSIFSAITADTNPGNGTSSFGYVAGTRGFTHLSRRPLSSDAGDVDWAPGLASFATYIDRRDKFSALTTVPTSLVLPLACSIQHTGNDELTVTGASNYFKKSISGVDQTSLVLGWTLFEITWSNPSDPVNTGAVSRLYRLKAIHTDKIVRLMGLDGTAAQFPGSLTGAILERIFTPTMVCPDGVQEMQYLRVNPNADLIEGGSFMALAPPRTSDTFGDLLVSGRAGYFGAYRMDAAAIAMEWGGYEHRTASTGGGTYRAMGSLRGNGDLHAVNIFASADVTITDDLFVGDNLNVGGNAAVEGTLTVLTDLVVEGVCVFQDDVGISGVLTASGVCSLGATTCSLLLLGRTRRSTSSTNFGVAGALALTTELATNNRATVVFTAAVNITSLSFPLVTLGTGALFEVLFDHRSFAGTISVAGWPAECVFEDPADKYLSGTVGMVDRYSFEYVDASTLLVSVKRYTP